MYCRISDSGKSSEMKKTHIVCLLGLSKLDIYHKDTYCYGLDRIAAHSLKKGLNARIHKLNRYVAGDITDDLKQVVEIYPDVLALSAYLWNVERVDYLISRTRELLTETLVVVGGPSAGRYRQFAPESKSPHYVIIGEGEKVFFDLVDSYLNGRKRCYIAPILEKEELVSCREPVIIEDAPPVANLDELGSPYTMNLGMPPGDRLYIETSRGCPHRCSFCIMGMCRAPLRFFSMDFLREELLWAKSNGKTDVDICDAAINYNSEHAAGFFRTAESIDPEGQLSFTFAVHADYITPDQISEMSRVNVLQASVGLNSLTPGTFKTVGRRVDRVKFARKIDMLNTVTRPSVSVIMGLPGDTVEGFRETLEFCAELDADINIFELKVFHDTGYYRDIERYKIVFDEGNSMNVVSTFSYTESDLEEMRAAAAEYARRFDRFSAGDVEQVWK